jgi:putative membrane protein
MNARRFPSSVFSGGQDPDIRFTLANERTFLAWVRTSLALLAGSIAVHTPVIDVARWATIAISLTLACAAMFALTLAWLRWRRVERAMRLGEPLPGFGGPAVVAAALALLAFGVALGTIVSAL